MAAGWRLRFWISVFMAAAWATTPASAQTFSSGSTGADGALNVTSGTTTVQLPPSGILNYTTVNVTSANLIFAPNAANSPVTILATGAVTIAGAILVNATTNQSQTNVPGPGGFYGGMPGQAGTGPAPGQYGKTDATENGKWLGPLNLVPLIGGSGGAGPNVTSCNNSGYNGGSGGGAILIASSTSILITGTINAQGNAAGYGCQNESTGAGGAIRLVSNSIDVSGTLQAAMVRLEAPTNGLVYTGKGTVPVTAPINPVLTPTNPPTVFITSIGGYPAPPPTTASWQTVDLLLPTQLPDPIAVIVQGQNVPVGSQVSLMFSGSAPTVSPSTTTLTGTTSSSTATFSVSGLSRTGITVVSVVTTFSTTQLSASLKQFGPNAVDKVEVAAVLGKPAKYRFLRADGTEVASANLSPELKRLFGY